MAQFVGVQQKPRILLDWQALGAVIGQPCLLVAGWRLCKALLQAGGGVEAGLPLESS